MRKCPAKYFLSIAEVVAEQSTCARAKVGAVLVDSKNNRIVSTGFSGSVPGAPHCIDHGCLMEDGHCRRTVHAEMNALLYMRGSYDDLTLYCTHSPCYQCVKALITANVKSVYYIKDYQDPLRERIINELKKPIELIKVEWEYEREVTYG